MREYLTFSSTEYFCLGRKDALSGSKKLTDEIIKELNKVNTSKEMFTRIQNYLTGYRIGILEDFLLRCGDNSKFNFKNNKFTRMTFEGEQTIDFQDGFNTFKQEAAKEAYKKLKL